MLASAGADVASADQNVRTGELRDWVGSSTFLPSTFCSIQYDAAREEQPVAGGGACRSRTRSCRGVHSAHAAADYARLFMSGVSPAGSALSRVTHVGGLQSAAFVMTQARFELFDSIEQFDDEGGAFLVQAEVAL